jgi:hypothetical protein
MRDRPWSGGVSYSSPSPCWHRENALEPFVAVAVVSLAVLTLLVPARLETPTGWDPDRHSGRADWEVAVARMLCTDGAAIGARRRLRAAATR